MRRWGSAYDAAARCTYKTVRHFTTWNEPNNGDQPTSFARGGVGGPVAAARYFKVLKRLCKTRGRTCWIGAGDFIDLLSLHSPNASGAQGKSYYFRYVDALKKAHINYWAIHPYVADRPGDATRSAAAYQRPFRRFMERTANYPGTSRVWLTEYGRKSNFSTTKTG